MSLTSRDHISAISPYYHLDLDGFAPMAQPIPLTSKLESGSRLFSGSTGRASSGSELAVGTGLLTLAGVKLADLCGLNCTRS